MFILSSAVSSFFLFPSKAKHMQQKHPQIIHKETWTSEFV